MALVLQRPHQSSRLRGCGSGSALLAARAERPRPTLRRAEFEQYAAPTSKNVPLFGPIVVDSPAKAMKQLLYSFNGMKGTDENVKFLEEARRQQLPWLRTPRAAARAYLGPRRPARRAAAPGVRRTRGAPRCAACFGAARASGCGLLQRRP